MEDFNTSNVTKIGSGGYGTVYQITMNNGEKCAMKTMKRSRNKGLRYDTVREIVFLKSLDSKGIVPKLRGVRFREKMVDVVMELYEMSLSKYGKKHSFSKRMKHLREVYEFIMYVLGTLMSYNIQHLDIKPGNIVMNKGKKFELRLVDFGFAHHAQSWKERGPGMFATRWYRPPECLYSRSVRVPFMGDAWCAGLTLVQYILGTSLWKPNDIDELKKCIARVEKTHRISEQEFLYNLEHGIEFEGGIDVEKVLGRAADEVPRDILKTMYAMLTFDPRVRARKLGIKKSDVSFDHGVFHRSSDIIEKMLARKLYKKDNEAFDEVKRKLDLSTEKLCRLEEDTIQRYVQG